MGRKLQKLVYIAANLSEGKNDKNDDSKNVSSPSNKVLEICFY